MFDPRDWTYKVSDNPALVLGYIANINGVVVGWAGSEHFWDNIGKMADYCDQEIKW